MVGMVQLMELKLWLVIVSEGAVANWKAVLLMRTDSEHEKDNFHHMPHTS